MKKIRKALLILMIAALTLSLCACDFPGRYTEMIIDVGRDGDLSYAATLLTAVEDPDVDEDGEPETQKEIIEFKREEFTKEFRDMSDREYRETLREQGIRSMEFQYKIMDGVVYAGVHADLSGSGGKAGLDLKKDLGLRAEHSFGKVTLRIAAGELGSASSEEESAETAPAPAETPETEHAPSYSYLIVHMPGRAKTNAGTAEGNTVTIDLGDPSQWEDLDDIVISAPVFEPVYAIVPAVLLAALVVWLLIRRKKRVDAAKAAEEMTQEADAPAQTAPAGDPGPGAEKVSAPAEEIGEETGGKE